MEVYDVHCGKDLYWGLKILSYGEFLDTTY